MARFKLRVRGGSKERVRDCPDGFERRGGACVKTSAKDKLTRKKAGKKRKISLKKGVASRVRKMLKSKKRRKTLGIDKK